MKILFMALALLSAAGFARAEKFTLVMPKVDPAERYAQEFFPRKLEQDYLSYWERSPVPTFNSFVLADLVRDLRTVKYKWLNHGFAAGSGGRRAGGLHLVKTRTAILNTDAWVRMLPREKKLMTLHESLGALGYDDEEYQLTFALDWFTNQLKAKKVRTGVEPKSPFAVNVKRSGKEKTYNDTNNQYAMSGDGGSTHIGGGGSECEMFIKNAVMEKFTSDAKLAPLAMNLQVFCDVPIDNGIQIDEAHHLMRPFSVRWEKGRLVVHTSMLLEIMGHSQPWAQDFIQKEFAAAAKHAK